MKAKDILHRIWWNLPLPASAYVYSLGRRSVFKDARRPVFEAAFQRLAARGFQGDYLEFGVYRGTGFCTAYHAAQKFGCTNIRFFAFDSFQGLPEDEGSIFKQGMYAIPKDVFEKTARKAGVDMNRVIIEPGFFTETLSDRKRSPR